MTTNTSGTEINDIEQMTFDENDDFELPPPDVIAYNELRSCADLFRMYHEGILEIHPHFQRETVWSVRMQTRFIDSLMKQLPIPSMCFSLDYKTQRWQVIDGLQRMATLIRFLDAEDWKLARLNDIDPAISGQSVQNFSIDPSLHDYYLRVRNLTLPITVIRCDTSKHDHMNYLFTIFHRLNTGGEKLNNQEIRNCIFSGPFNDLLSHLDQNPIWLSITGRTSASGDRFRGREQILRFFALRDKYPDYKGKLASFLNQYMLEHRNPDATFLKEHEGTFLQTIELTQKAVVPDGDESHRRIPLAVLEAVLVGVSLNLDALRAISSTTLRSKYSQLLASDEFAEDKLKEGLSGRPRVLGRMSTAEHVFSVL